MTFKVYRPSGEEIGAHACYSPAEKQAKETFGAVVDYVGVRGQFVRVWPLAPLTKLEAPIDYHAEPYL